MTSQHLHQHHHHHRHSHHHNSHNHHNHHQTSSGGGHSVEDISASVEHVFDQFVTAVTCKSILSTFNQLVDLTGLRHADHHHFYNALKGKLAGSWKGQALWSKLDKRAAHRDYKRGQAAKDMRVLVIGAGPCGLRTAIECAFLGAKTVVVEKRDRFSRNNVLHLWPYLITDLRNLGAKKFFGKFCAGSIDHISIRQLQCILMKVALLVGVEVHVNVAFEGLVEPPEDQSSDIGWRCNVDPANHVLSEFVFDVLIGADGKRNTLPGFKRKEFRGKLAIAITANFINRNTQEEARVEEISGVAFIFNQKFFHDLKESTRIDLENIVYYKDDTHYFVMTAKKASLLEKGVLKEDHSDTITLLDRSNVNQDRLLSYAKEAANFSTNYQLPNLDYAVNHYGQADVAMFDFTSMFAADNASRFILKNGHHLLMGLVGDSLLEPFWPTGSGCARGFLGAFDAAWMIRSWASGNMKPLQVLAERESIYTVLSQTTPNYLHKNFTQYSIDPNTRYPNLNRKCVKPFQVRQYYEGGEFNENEDDEEADVSVPVKKPRNNEEIIDSYNILRWCQRVLNTGKYRDVHIVDFTSSWRSGLALCALIHSFRPELIDMNCLLESDVAANNQLAFNVSEQELGIPPVMCGTDMAKQDGPDKLTMVAYLAQFYQLFRQDVLPSTIEPPVVMRNKRKSVNKDGSLKSPRSPSRRISFLQRLSSRLAKSKKRKEQEMNEASPLSSKKMKEKQEMRGEAQTSNKLPMEEIANRLQVNQQCMEAKPAGVRPGEDMTGAISVTAMAEMLRAKFKSLEDQPAPEPIRRMKGQPALAAASSASEFCSFCHKRVYIMERMSAEGEFFHRGCFKCDHCYVGLRLNNYSCDKDAKPVKFYCYRHALPEMRIRRRKRLLEEEAKENVPHTVIQPPPEDKEDNILASKEKSPRKAAAAGLSPLTLPSDMTDKPSKTPERVEFEISFDGQEEESEEEQFEHNLRASMSSDTLLDDEDESDSDSSDDLDDDDDEYDYLSESEMAWILDEWSGAEDDVWESASELPGSPLTSEELIELVGSLRSRHQSREDYLEQRKYQRLREGEDREGDDDEEEYVEDEDEDESTEVEEGESEYETDSSEEDSLVKNAPKVIKQTPVAADDRKLIKTSARTPTSPSTRLSASKASFFSEPPKVVSLDPWSMFGMGNKKGKAKVVENEGKGKQLDNGAVSDEDRTASVSESTRKSVENGFVEDASESWETEGKSSMRNKEQKRSLSEAGSVDELEEELEVDDDDDDDEEEKEEVKQVDVKKKGILSKSKSFDLEEEENRDTEKGAEDGDDEEDEKEAGDDEDEMLEKTAVTHAMEQLLKDIDHKGKEGKGLDLDDHHRADTSSSGENESFIEGRLSPSALKTRKFRMRRQAVRQKNAKRQQRSGRSSLTSESEAARTDPTTTDNSRPQSTSVSRSPSVELEKLKFLSVPKPENVQENDDESCKSAAILDEEKSQHKEENIPDNKSYDDGNIEIVGRDENLGTRNIPDVNLEDIDTVGVSTTGDDTLRRVLESIAAMPDLSQDSDVDDIVFSNIDDRHVTSRRRKPGKRTTVKLRKIGSSKTEKPEGDADSSFSISTPSDSESSVSSVEGQGLSTTDRNDEDDEAPDEEMLKEYQTTMSLALEESFSDGETEGDVKGIKDDVESVSEKTEEITGNDVVGEESTENMDDEKAAEIGRGSLYFTPEVDTEKNVEPFSRHQKSPISPQPVVNSQTPTSSSSSSSSASTSTSSAAVVLSNKKNLSPDLSTPSNNPLNDTRESTGSDIFVSPLESFSSPPPLRETPPNLYKTPASSFTPQVPKQIISHPVTKDLDKARNDPDLSSKHSSTNSLSSSSSSSQKSSNLKEAALNSETISSNLSTTKPQRKLPELPKLKVPSRQTVRGGNITIESPVSCSSPKLSSRLNQLPGLDNKGVSSPKLGRPLPIPNISSPSTSKSRILPTHTPSSSTVTSSSISTSASTPTSTSSLSSRVPASTPISSIKSISPSSIPSSTAVSSISSSTQPSTSASSLSSSSSKSIPSSFGAKLSSQPISPPIFRPPSKIPNAVDKKKISVRLSADQADSDQDVGKKKRISAEGISVESNGIEEDIPFADESSEFEEKFYTPHSTVKQQKPSFPDTSKYNARKRILPNPPSGSSDPTVLSADQIRQIRKADMEKAKVQARERARLKSDEELGISVGNSISDTPSKAQSRVKTKLQNEISTESGSYDTQSASDNNVLSDSDDKLSSFNSPASSASEQNTKFINGKDGKKTKVKGEKQRKAKKEKKETDSEKKEKRKSLLALILPGKSSPDKSNNKENLTNSVDKDSEDSSRLKLSKTKSPKSTDKKSKRRGNNNRSKSNSRESLDKTPVVEGKKDLAICSVFHSEATNKANLLTPTNPLRRSLPPIAPKASIDEFSDSDESHISQFTVRKMEDNLDERVSRRLRKIQQKQQRQAQQKRLRMAQEIQRQLEEVEVRQRELEERGTAVEKILRGDGPDDVDFDEGKLMNEWFSLVHEKNALLRYESELNVRAKELELEDRQARLESDFRERSRKAENLKTDADIRVEGQLLDELLDVVEQRNTLVAMLEEDRLREKKEDEELHDMMKHKGYVLSPLSYDTRRDRQNVNAPLASPAL